MDHNNFEILNDSSGKPGLNTDWENSECSPPEEEQSGCSSVTLTEDLTNNGSWSQRSISRSLQRAETILRSTFNPSLKWLFPGRSQDEEEEEGNFVVAHNLVSRSSARLLRLQQALLTVAPQWPQVGRAHMGSPQVCVKGLPAEGGVFLLPSSSFLHEHYGALRKLLEHRSLLLFIHEYTRRARLTAAFISRVGQLLEDQRMKSHLTANQNLSSFRVNLGPLCQELRVHLNHWSCLSSKVQSDYYLRPALVQHTKLLVQIRQTLDILGLQALVLMEQYVHVVLSGLAHTDVNNVPREVLEGIVAGTDLYNQAVEEQRAQHSTAQRRLAILQQACYSTNSHVHQPAAVSVKDLVKILAVHHADMVAKQLYCWASQHSNHICKYHTNHSAYGCPDNPAGQLSRVSCGIFTGTSKRTWEQLQDTYLTSPATVSINPSPFLQSSAHHTCHKTPVYSCDHHLDCTVLEQHHPALAKPSSVQHIPELCSKDRSRRNFPNQCQTTPTGLVQTSVEVFESNPTRETSLQSCQLLKTESSSSTILHHLSAFPLSEFCQQEQSMVELLFQVLVSSNDLLAPLASHTSTAEAPKQPLPHTDVLPPKRNTDHMITSAPQHITNRADSAEWNRRRREQKQRTDDCNTEGTRQEWAESEITSKTAISPSSGLGRNGDQDEDERVGAQGSTVEPDCARRPRSVQWLDLGQSLVFEDLFGQYRTLLWAHCSKALWLQLHVPHAGNTAGSINLHDNHRAFQILHSISQASETDQVPNEFRAVVEDFSLYVLVTAAHAQWDNGVCKSLGSALKDKCLPDVNQGSTCMTASAKQEGSVMTSVTMEHLLQLSSPLLSSLCCYQSHCETSGSLSVSASRLTLQGLTVRLVVATVQLSAVWVMSKAYQFLSSWNLNKFLLITQGDLKVLRESLDVVVQQTKSLMMNSDDDRHSVLHNHNQLLLKQQLAALDRAVSELQTFSSLVLMTFSSDCKRMSGEIFEQTMPSAPHWRLNHRTGFSGLPGEYVSQAAQTVIGQVLEGVAPQSDDDRVQALSITMTAFMEAWMEHILKQRIKFSVQGALQLKQDFDSIRELIQSEKYGLSEELHQRLLSLRVFQQVDSAVLCLLQQPQVKPYLPSSAWEPFTRCCPAKSSRDSFNGAVDSSITNLRSMDGDEMTQSNPSVVATDIPPVDPFTPGEPYFAPSLALGASQQDWLDLRILTSTRRWRLPGLQCLSKSEP